MKRVTIKDIANDLGLSVSTVSRALSGDALVRPETRRDVREAAKRLGYRRNPMAANLRSGKSFMIGVIVNELLTPASAEICRGIQNVARANGFNIIILSSEEDAAHEMENISNLTNSAVDGLLISSADGISNLEALRDLQASGVPVIFFDRRPNVADGEFSSVTAPYGNKAFFLVEHLLQSGRRRIVHLCGGRSVEKYRDIHKAYNEALRKYRIDPDPKLILELGSTVKAGREAADRLLDSGVEFDAVFACSDLAAIGFMNRLMERGCRVPEQIAVAGFGGSPLSNVIYPSLTTVEPDLTEMGRCAAELLLDKIKNQDSPHESRTVGAKIRLRHSSGAAAI